MQHVRRLVGKIAASFLLLALAGCAGEVTSQETGESLSDADQVLALIDGAPIRAADLQQDVSDQLATLKYQYDSQRYQMLQNGLDQVVRQRLIETAAQAAGVSADEFVQTRLEGKLQVSDADVEAWYAANQSRLQGRTLDMLRSAIHQFLTEQQQEAVLADLTKQLRANRQVEVLLQPFRAQLGNDGHPSIGPEAAPVTLVEFSDFECPYCGGFFGTIERVRQEYEGQVRLVYRQFPLRQIHPHAQKAAEASLCAAEQHQFWPLHDVMFGDQQALAVDDLKEKATRLGLDAPAFAACLDSGKYVDQIDADLRAGARLGITGTPALFVNGRPIDGGAVPFEQIAAVIDDELARADR